MRRAVRRILLALLVLALVPYALVLLYGTVRPLSTPMLWRWVTGSRVERVWVPIEAIAPSLPLSVIAAEDGRFCAHRGIDWRELRAAVRDADELGDLRGASTVTQQVVKNLFLWQGRSYVRKALEV